MAKENTTPNGDWIIIKDKEQLFNLKDKFNDVVVAVNNLEERVLGESMTPGYIGYQVGRLFNSVKDIMKILNIDIETQDITEE